MEHKFRGLHSSQRDQPRVNAREERGTPKRKPTGVAGDFNVGGFSVPGLEMKNALSVIAACSLRVAAAAAYLLTFVEERKIIMSCQQVELNHSIGVWELAEPEAREQETRLVYLKIIEARSSLACCVDNPLMFPTEGTNKNPNKLVLHKMQMIHSGRDFVARLIDCSQTGIKQDHVTL